MGASSAKGVCVELQEELLELRMVLDARLRIDDVVAVVGGDARPDMRPLLGRPAVELFEMADRKRVNAALREAVDGRGCELSAVVELDGRASPQRVHVQPGERFIHVTLSPCLTAVVSEPPPPVDPPRAEPSARLEHIGMVASRISHDFKNLLAAILVNAEFLRRDAVDTETVHEVADEIRIATERARELIEQILGYAGSKTEPRSLIDLNALTQEMGRLLDVSTSPTVVMRYDLQADPPTVHGQASRLRQVLLNFIVNAAEAIGSDVGRISIGTSVVEASADLLGRTRTTKVPPPGRYVCLEVEDTGPGLDAATADKIFDPFFSTKRTGHGLGLSACLTTIEDHGGALLLDSVPGQGARFRTFLPCAVERDGVVVDATGAADDRDFTGYCVLVIDDEDLVRSVTRRTLRARGFEVLTARDGLEGIEQFDTHHERLDAVLLDMGMPFMKGSDVFDELRRIDPRVPVIFVSGQSEEELRQIGAVGEADGVVPKPFRDADLLDALMPGIERRRSERG